MLARPGADLPQVLSGADQGRPAGVTGMASAPAFFRVTDARTR